MTTHETYAAIFVIATGIYLVVYAIGNSIKPEPKPIKYSIGIEKAPKQFCIKSTSHSCVSCGAKSATNHKCDYCGNEIVEQIGIIHNKIPSNQSEIERIEKELRRLCIAKPTPPISQYIN